MLESCSFAFFLDRMLELEHREVQLHDCFRIRCPEFIVKNLGNDFSAFAHQGLLFGLVLNTGKGFDVPGEFPDLGEGFDDGERRLHGLVAFEDPG